MTPDELEAHIRDCGRLMQQAMDDYEASGCFSDRGEADYWRVRMGIGHPGHKDAVTGHVLGNFAKQDQAWLERLLDAVADCAPMLAEGKPEDFMTRVALLTQEG